MEWFIGLAAVVLVAVVLIGLFHGPSHRADRADRRAKAPDPSAPATPMTPGTPDATAEAASAPATHLTTTPTAQPPLELPDSPAPAYVLPPAPRPRGLRRRPVKRPRGRQS